MMGMTPKTFWNTSPQEIYMAIDGFIEFNSGGKEQETPMTSDRLKELQELYPDE
tara:strand:- start:3152 stop:3313 length:162 start_codon:yes stop_codon:yes gene_type:complete